jgi:glutamine synthetase adenylyltransferase
MGYRNWEDLRADIESHRAAIADQFAHIAFRESSAETPLHKQVEQAWESGADEGAWLALLESEGIGEARAIASALGSFAADTVTRQIDTAARAHAVYRRTYPAAQCIPRAAQRESWCFGSTRGLVCPQQIHRRTDRAVPGIAR